jgi:hypothetical protein
MESTQMFAFVLRQTRQMLAWKRPFGTLALVWKFAIF